MDEKEDGVTRDPAYGFWRLEPFPQDEELSQFYQNKYYDLIRSGGRAPDIKRFMIGGLEAERERAWFHSTFYADISYILNKYSPTRRILDIGCGTGEFISYLKTGQFDTVGIEPSTDAIAIATANGLTAYPYNLDEYITYHQAHRLDAYGAVTLINVLEHVPNPLELIDKTKQLLEKEGLICIKVPNDFNPLQLAARQQLGKRAWWITRPDHTHYFNFSSLKKVLTQSGFEVVHTQSEFPMEMFILMGDDYIDNPEIGVKCHQKRVAFDLALPDDVRRRLYKSLAEAGIGRTCTIIGKLQNNLT